MHLLSFDASFVNYFRTDDTQIRLVLLFISVVGWILFLVGFILLNKRVHRYTVLYNVYIYHSSILHGYNHHTCYNTRVSSRGEGGRFPQTLAPPLPKKEREKASNSIQNSNVTTIITETV